MGKSSTQNQTSHQTTLQNTHQNTNATVTPTNPQYVADALRGLTGNVTDLANTDPYSLFAGADPLQTQAATGAAGLTGAPVVYAGANDLASSIGQMNAPDIASLMAPFKRAFDSRVIDPALAGFDQNSALTNEQNKLNLGNDTTFGGSGASITDALTRGQQALARGQLQGGLLSDQFKTALGGATSQAGVNLSQQGLRLNAAGQLVSSANDQDSTQRADIATQGGIGSILQALAQARAGAPVSLAGTTAGILGSLPLGLLHGQDSTAVQDGTTQGTTDGTQHTTTTESDPLGSLGTAALTAAALFGAPFTGGTSLGLLGGLLGSASGIAPAMAGISGALVSDLRAKTDIKKVGKMDDGLPVYTYRYKGGGPVQMGVMAQEAAKVKPHAVHDIGGLLAVNYGAL